MNASPDPDALDGLLTDFFRSELPHPFPKAPVPPAAEIVPAGVAGPMPSSVSHSGGRAVLAASVALLAGVCWYLASPVPTDRPPRPDEFPNDVTATVPKELRAPAPPAPKVTGREKR